MLQILFLAQMLCPQHASTLAISTSLHVNPSYLTHSHLTPNLVLILS